MFPVTGNREWLEHWSSSSGQRVNPDLVQDYGNLIRTRVCSTLAWMLDDPTFRGARGERTKGGSLWRTVQVQVG